MSPDVPDALLLGGPKLSTEFNVYVKTSLSANSPNKDEEMERFAKNFGQIYVYKEADLLRDVKLAELAYTQINHLLVHLSDRDHEERAQARISLLADRQFRDCFANLCQKNNPESHQK